MLSEITRLKVRNGVVAICWHVQLFVIKQSDARSSSSAPREVPQSEDLDEGVAGRVWYLSCLSRSKFVNRAWLAFRHVSDKL